MKVLSKREFYNTILALVESDPSIENKRLYIAFIRRELHYITMRERSSKFTITVDIDLDTNY